MENKLEKFISSNLKKRDFDFKTGDQVIVHSRFKEDGKDKTILFEGLVLKRNHGKDSGATFTVRKVIDGIGVERTFPLHSPLINKVEILKSYKVRRAKLYYLRKATGKRAKLKEIK